MRFFKKHKILTIILIIFSVYLYRNYTRIVETNNMVDKNSPHYVNNLYASDGRIYSDYLDSSEKKIYMKILNNTKKYKDRFELVTTDYDCKDIEELQRKLFKVYDAILIDHPELMNYAGISWRWKDYEGDTVNVSLYLAYSNKYKEYLGELRIQRVIADIREATRGMSDVEKIKYVYNWMGDHEKYDYTFTTFSKNQSIYNVFMKGNAVCAGFAKASQVIFQNIGIESYTITGGTEGPHMWNIVKADGNYYYYDSTVAVCRNKTSSGYYDGLRSSKFEEYTVNNSEWFNGIDVEKEKELIK